MKSVWTRGFVTIVLAAPALLSGCSTIVEGHSQQITINSNVRDAEIKLNGLTVGRTPFTGLIDRSHRSSVTVSKDGYQSKTVTLDTDVDAWFFGNIIFGGLVGSTTDASTGAMYKYSPATIEVDLEVASAGK